MITQEQLNLRISPNANKYLLIFPNKQIMQWYKRYLLRNDIIYKTEFELENNGLDGLRYINWNYVDETMTKQIINNKMPILDIKNQPTTTKYENFINSYKFKNKDFVDKFLKISDITLMKYQKIFLDLLIEKSKDDRK